MHTSLIIELSGRAATACLVTTLVLTVLSSKARANDTTLSHFTRSIATVYSASKSCENTIAPGPKEYIVVIGAYLLKLYPNGVNYWVLPRASKMISDPDTCIRLMQNRLLDYRNARVEFNKTYPHRSPPPILFSYQWDKYYYEPVPEVPTKSYLPPGIRQQQQQPGRFGNKSPVKEKFLVAPALQ